MCHPAVCIYAHMIWPASNGRKGKLGYIYTCNTHITMLVQLGQ
jgi:hypothetical protein